MSTWQLKACALEPRLQMWRSCTPSTPAMSFIEAPTSIEIDAARQTFKQDVQRFADDVPGGPNDQAAR